VTAPFNMEQLLLFDNSEDADEDAEKNKYFFHLYTLRQKQRLREHLDNFDGGYVNANHDSKFTM